MSQGDWTRIFIGQVTESELINIVREVKNLWQFGAIVWPQGDRKRRAQIKAVKDAQGQYWILINGQALTYLMLRCKNIEPLRLSSDK